MVLLLYHCDLEAQFLKVFTT